MEQIVGEFIRLDIDLNRCLGIERCGKCIQVCLVSIFTSDDDYRKHLEAKEDERTLCNICLQGCEVDAISIQKLYEHRDQSC
jgi:ferredoxin